mgnify:CR=1 FL=1
MAEELAGSGVGPDGEAVTFYSTGRLDDYCVRGANGKNIISGDMLGLNMLGYRMTPKRPEVPQEPPAASQAPASAPNAAETKSAQE